MVEFQLARIDQIEKIQTYLWILASLQMQKIYRKKSRRASVYRILWTNSYDHLQ